LPAATAGAVGGRGGNSGRDRPGVQQPGGFGPDGGRLAFYRKIHLFDAQGFGEYTFTKPDPSTAPVVFEHRGLRFGLMTCYDLRFPELRPITSRRRCSSPAGLLILGAGRAQDGAVAGVERGPGDREQRVRGGGMPGAAGVGKAERAGGPNGPSPAKPPPSATPSSSPRSDSTTRGPDAGVVSDVPAAADVGGSVRVHELAWARSADRVLTQPQSAAWLHPLDQPVPEGGRDPAIGQYGSLGAGADPVLRRRKIVE
jgi:hypothetical protein